jgi:DNA-binding response OmpR family regulator
MVTNFEEFTFEVNKYEKRAANYIEALLRSTGKIYSNRQLAEMIYQRSGELKEYKFADSRIRSIINYLRRTSAPNMIAGQPVGEQSEKKNTTLKKRKGGTI